MTYKEQELEFATLAEAARRYGVQPEDLTELSGGWVNHIYGFERRGAGYVVRISPLAVRTPELVCAEADWIGYLADHGVPAARVIPSCEGRVVEVIILQGGFTAVAYERARGHLPRKDELTLPFWNRLGAITGRMHRLARDYVLPVGVDRSAETVCGPFSFGSIPPDQEAVISRARDVLTDMSTWPRGRDSWGLIHGDLHPNNLFVTETGEMTLFDFDDFCENWYLLDIATALFFGMWAGHPGETNRAWYDDLYEAFITGYDLESSLDQEWLGNRFQTAMKYQELCCYTMLNDDWHLGDGGHWEDVPPGWKMVLERYRRNIEGDVPAVEGAFNIWEVAAQTQRSVSD